MTVEERGEHIERVVEIYESADAAKTEMKDTSIKTRHTGTRNFPETPDIIKGQKCSQETEGTKSNQTRMHNRGGEAWSRCYRVTAVCVLLLCVLLLTTVTVLWVKYNNLNKENNQLQIRYNNVSMERDQLQTSYNNLSMERDQLQTSYNNLSMERDQLQRERDKYLRTSDDFCKWRCFRFSPSFYYMPNEKKSWNESRQHCWDNGADLVIINSSEEQNFISNQLGTWRAWIGLSDRDEEEKWKWVDGTPLITKSWASGEPNNAGDEDCAEIFSTSTGGAWNDQECSDKQHWICEKRVSL